MIGRDKDSGRTATSLLATCYVFASGALVCSFIALAFSNDPAVPLLIVGGSFLLVFILLSLLRDKRGNSWLEGGYYWLLRRRPDECDIHYTPRVIKDQPQQYGTNEPPTAEEIRELSGGLNTWVPSNEPGKKGSSG